MEAGLIACSMDFLPLFLVGNVTPPPEIFESFFPFVMCSYIVGRSIKLVSEFPMIFLACCYKERQLRQHLVIIAPSLKPLRVRVMMIQLLSSVSLSFELILLRFMFISIIYHMSACCLLFVQLTQQLLVLLCTSFRSHREVSWCERRKESERKREKRFLGRRERELETEQQRTKTTQISNKPQTSNCCNVQRWCFTTCISL